MENISAVLLLVYCLGLPNSGLPLQLIHSPHLFNYNAGIQSSYIKKGNQLGGSQTSFYCCLGTLQGASGQLDRPAWGLGKTILHNYTLSPTAGSRGSTDIFPLLLKSQERHVFTLGKQFCQTYSHQITSSATVFLNQFILNKTIYSWLKIKH